MLDFTFIVLLLLIKSYGQTLHDGYTDISVDKEDTWNVAHPAHLPAHTAVIQGDILVNYDTETRKMVPNEAKKWPGGIIKWANAINETKFSNAIKEAISQFHQKTCLTFKELSPDSKEYHLRFVKKPRPCCSFLGYIKEGWHLPYQTIHLADSCANKMSVLHEVCHALGMGHEMTRPDRDKHMKILQANAYKKDSGFLTYGVKFDYSSIMMYHSLAFSNNYLPIMATIPDPLHEGRLGKSNDLSFYDAKALNIHYKCIDKWKSSCSAKSCQNDGYLNAKCACVCPRGTTGVQCETVSGPYYEPMKCRERITKSGTEFGNPMYPKYHTSSQDCMWHMIAPEGQVPRLTLTSVKLKNIPIPVFRDRIGIRKNNEWNTTYYFFNDPNLRIGKKFYGCNDQRQLVISWYSLVHSYSGFKAKVDFVPKSECNFTVTQPVSAQITTNVGTNKSKCWVEKINGGHRLHGPNIEMKEGYVCQNILFLNSQPNPMDITIEKLDNDMGLIIVSDRYKYLTNKNTKYTSFWSRLEIQAYKNWKTASNKFAVTVKLGAPRAKGCSQIINLNAKNPSHELMSMTRKAGDEITHCEYWFKTDENMKLTYCYKNNKLVEMKGKDRISICMRRDGCLGYYPYSNTSTLYSESNMFYVSVTMKEEYATPMSLGLFSYKK